MKKLNLKFLFTSMACLLLGILVGGAVIAQLPRYRALDGLNDSLREAVYCGLEDASGALASYCAEPNQSEIDEARDALTGVLGTVDACGGYMGYRAPYDTADDAIQAAAIDYLRSAQRALSMNPSEARVREVAAVLAPVENSDGTREEHVTLIGIYWNLSQRA